MLNPRAFRMSPNPRISKVDSPRFNLLFQAFFLFFPGLGFLKNFCSILAFDDHNSIPISKDQITRIDSHVVKNQWLINPTQKSFFSVPLMQIARENAGNPSSGHSLRISHGPVKNQSCDSSCLDHYSHKLRPRRLPQ